MCLVVDWLCLHGSRAGRVGTYDPELSFPTASSTRWCQQGTKPAAIFWQIRIKEIQQGSTARAPSAQSQPVHELNGELGPHLHNGLWLWLQGYQVPLRSRSCKRNQLPRAEPGGTLTGGGALHAPSLPQPGAARLSTGTSPAALVFMGAAGPRHVYKLTDA